MAKLTKVALKEDYLSLCWEGGLTYNYHYIWLRDNCMASSRYDARTGERIARTEEIDPNLKITSVEMQDDTLIFRWSDKGEDSRFQLDWLVAHHYGTSLQQEEQEVVSWDGTFMEKIPSYEYNDVIALGDMTIQMIRDFEKYGLVKINNTPIEDRQVEKFANHLTYVREIIFDRVANIRVSENPYNIGFTDQALPLHTDCSGYAWPPNMMAFHCMENSVDGGENIYVDGQRIIEQLRAEKPEVIDILEKVEVDFRLYSKSADTTTRKPPIILDQKGNLKTLRYANWTVQPLTNLSFVQVKAYYQAYRVLSEFINRPENLVECRLRPGEMLLMNNQRILHGRKAFTSAIGTRHFQQVYMELDDLSGLRRILETKDREKVA